MDWFYNFAFRDIIKYWKVLIEKESFIFGLWD